MEAFGTVLIVVCLLAVVFAAISYRGTGGIYSGLGREGGLSMDGDEAGASRRAAAPRRAVARPPWLP
jgi:hypothetical protein